jgi:prolyl 4-hydroxylase
MKKPVLDDLWKRWLEENLERECDPNELVSILLQNRFSLDSIREAMGEKFPAGAELLDVAEPDYQAISETRLTRHAADPKLQKVGTDKLQLYVLDDFMSGVECDTMIEIIGRRLRPSTVTKESGDEHFRTSRTSDLSLLSDPIIASIDQRIAKTLGIRIEYSEGIQAQRYDVGQEFKAHTDYFERGTAEYVEHTAIKGNRTWTFMVYLNEDMQGGVTRFPAIDRDFHPRKGQAIIWNSLYPDGTPNPDTLHSGTPVTRGHKLIITKWFRERGNGPMFYEDE